MATGDTLFAWTANQSMPPASNFATPDTRGAVDPHEVRDFDASTNESLIFAGVMPQNYAGTTGVTFKLHYGMSSATSGDVDIDVSMEAGADMDTASFASVVSVDGTTVPGTSGNIEVISIALTDGAQMDSAAAGNYFRVKVTRDAASDTAAGDLELVALEMQET